MSWLSDPMDVSDHVIGRPNAPVELVEYGDYTCPLCAKAHLEVLEVLWRSGDVLRYAFRHFPLFLRPYALVAAQAAEAAAAQGRFWPMHALLLEHRDAAAPQALASHAELLGLDVTRFAQDLRSARYLPRVQRDVRTGVRSGVSGTPTFFLDGSRVERGWDAESLMLAIERRVRPRGAEASA